MIPNRSWRYFRWQESDLVPLKAVDVLVTQASPTGKKGDELHHLIRYADMYYLSCRILMMASYEVHPPALYAAGQAVEKYLKALLLHRTETFPKNTHNLKNLATQVNEAFAENDPSIAALFGDEEFLTLCQHLQEFDIAGRYKPNKIDSWNYYLNLLSFLDAFVVKCRELVGLSPGHPNVVRDLLRQDTANNEVMAAAITAVRDNNHYLEELLNPGTNRSWE